MSIHLQYIRMVLIPSMQLPGYGGIHPLGDMEQSLLSKCLRSVNQGRFSDCSQPQNTLLPLIFISIDKSSTLGLLVLLRKARLY